MSSQSQDLSIPDYDSPKIRDQIISIFTYHAPQPNQIPRYEEIRSWMRQVALVINRNCPTSREKSLALTHLQMASMWANAAIACNEASENYVRGEGSQGPQPSHEVIVDSKQWFCSACGKPADPASGEWRWNGFVWEHSHGYPIGHIPATRTVKIADNPAGTPQ